MTFIARPLTMPHRSGLIQTPVPHSLMTLESLHDGLSPSFGRSGVLSPSFRGNVFSLLSPCAIGQLDIMPAMRSP
jgi:hypothetical protein